MASQQRTADAPAQEQSTESRAPTSPTNSSTTNRSSSTGYSSLYRRRLDRQRRREALDHLAKVHRIRPRASHHAETVLTPSSSLDEQQQQPRQQSQQEKSIDTSPEKGSLVEKQAKLFGGSVARKRATDADHERKSSASGGGTTVTTETVSTALTHHTAKHNGYAVLADDSSDQTPKRSAQSNEIEHPSTTLSPTDSIRQGSQHLETHKEEEGDVKYYRILYPGVAALLSRPDRHAPKSGAYVSYGDVVASRFEMEIEEEESTVVTTATPVLTKTFSESEAKNGGSPESPQSLPRSLLSQHTGGSVSSLDTLKTTSTAVATTIKQKPGTMVTKKIIRVDEVLTGGYAVDANDELPSDGSSLTTPKRSNTHYFPMAKPSPLLLAESRSVATSTDASSGLGHLEETGEDAFNAHGYLYVEKKGAMIAEPIAEPPKLQRGNFLYSIVSSTPLPIVTGPSLDAPKTKAMLLPGTVHEVCLKMNLPDTAVTFLRLSHRRGWITDRRVASVGGTVKVGVLPAVVEVANSGTLDNEDDATVSALSVVSRTTAASGSLARRRHRPPRRKRETGGDSGTPGRHRTHIPQKLASSSPVRGQKVVSPVPGDKPKTTPSSNISLISEDESFDVSTHYNLPGAAAAVRPHDSDAILGPSLFLMKVNAPRGLKILDAPHFQVSNLIHGTQESTHGKSLSRGSIFQTMAAHHTTRGPSARSGNPAVFDALHKTRMLPRGALFEASRRMEQSGGFDKGAGLIKLADGSGWAIVPKQEDLDEQYRRYRGGVASVKEGEATRAYEEVGNAIVAKDEHTGQTREDAFTVQWLRIVSRQGVDVACPPASPPLSNDEDASPTSSTGGASSFGGSNSNYGMIARQDSDVASSVGSAFLDAMFRTPKKKEPTESTAQTDPRIPRSKSPQEVPTLLACGTCVEVDNWTEEESSNFMQQEYVRLKGGQGWIPLRSQGKVAAVNIARPDLRLGSFWFRVMSQRGIKVRMGPSRKATSIKSDDGVYFRFECGEFLRASEIVTIFHENKPSESFAKLYRNRHVKLNESSTEYRTLASLTMPAEWVQVHGDDHLFLEECGEQPRIQRHREGWRYNVIAESGVSVRVGPSFASSLSGLVLLAGESVLVSERVTPPGETTTWLRLKDGKGWVHDLTIDGETVMIAHSLRHRVGGPLAARAPTKADRNEQGDDGSVAYNTIIARLFHSDGAHPGRPHGLASGKYDKK